MLVKFEDVKLVICRTCKFAVEKGSVQQHLEWHGLEEDPELLMRERPDSLLMLVNLRVGTSI